MAIERTHPEAAPAPPGGPGWVMLAAMALVLAVAGAFGTIGFVAARLVAERLRAPDRADHGLDGLRATPEEIGRLVGDLADDDWSTRSAATRRLIEIGEPALPQLRTAAAGDDLETRWRAEEAIREIEVRREEARASTAPGGPTR